MGLLCTGAQEKKKEKKTIDVNYIGTVSLRVKCVESVSREEASKVKIEYREFVTDITPLFATTHLDYVEIATKHVDRYNTALVCHRWCYLACHPRLWLRVDRSIKDLSEPGVFPNIEAAVSAAKPGDTILISAGGSHVASNIKIKKPLCLIGGGDLP
ncbi:hypothetical protein L1049_010986 [Liquidambar formosana]|uniref:Uncharacterized protein n=1 Tax=Liquidambar formosana TaxID=63359 RepID=A0AAP0RR17_LIQFO